MWCCYGFGYERSPEREQDDDDVEQVMESAQAQHMDAWSRAQPCDGEMRAVERVVGSPEPKPACNRAKNATPITASDVDEAFAVVADAHVQQSPTELPQSGWYHWLFGVHHPQEESTHTQ